MVVVHGLVGAMYHNGKLGRVLRRAGDGRWHVSIIDDIPSTTTKIAVKAVNLRLLGVGLAGPEVAAATTREGPFATEESTASHMNYKLEAPFGVKRTGFDSWCRDVHDCVACGTKHAINLCCDADRPLITGGRKTASHSGELELMTWDFIYRRAPPYYEPRHPRNVQRLASSPPMQKVFRDECGGSLPLFFQACPTAFRWTCCGLPGDCVRGCDHHGPGCKCDFCPGSASRAALIAPQNEAERLFAERFAESLGPPPYAHQQENRFLRLSNSPRVEWELAAGVPWSEEVHCRLPARCAYIHASHSSYNPRRPLLQHVCAGCAGYSPPLLLRACVCDTVFGTRLASCYCACNRQTCRWPWCFSSCRCCLTWRSYARGGPTLNPLENRSPLTFHVVCTHHLCPHAGQ